MCAASTKYERIPLLPKLQAEIQHVPSTGVYTFANDDIAQDEINTDKVELNELRARGKQTKNSSVYIPVTEDVCIEREVKEGDTIHSISLKYGCPVSELKRINNLIQDQDFFALQIIKIPAKRHGLLLELVEQERQNSDAINSDSHQTTNLFEETSSICDEEQRIGLNNSENNIGTVSESQVTTLSIRDTLSSQGQEASDFLQQMDSDIKNIVASTKNRLDSLEEVATVLTCRRIFPMRQKKQQSWGADCGIRWWNVVFVVFIIGLVTPLLYFVYYEYVRPT